MYKPVKSFSQNLLERFFDIFLHTSRLLYFRKIDTVKFVEKNVIFPKWDIFSQFRLKNCGCCVVGIFANDIFVIWYDGRDYGQTKAIIMII